MKNEIIATIQNSILVKQNILTDENLLNNIEKVCNIITECYKNGGKVLICGNGGSAADAQHMAGEFVGRFMLERKALPAIALSTDTSIITSIANDYSYDTIFERGVEAHLNKGDILIGISTSGNSKNVLNAFSKAKELGGITVALLGKDGGVAYNSCDIPLLVKSSHTPHVQESHIMIIHIICGIVEKELRNE